MDDLNAICERINQLVAQIQQQQHDAVINRKRKLLAEVTTPELAEAVFPRRRPQPALPPAPECDYRIAGLGELAIGSELTVNGRRYRIDGITHEGTFGGWGFGPTTVTYRLIDVAQERIDRTVETALALANETLAAIWGDGWHNAGIIIGDGPTITPENDGLQQEWASAFRYYTTGAPRIQIGDDTPKLWHTNPEDPVIDDIDQLVRDTLAPGPQDDYNANRYDRCPDCEHDWHGLACEYDDDYDGECGCLNTDWLNP